jgi:DUF4097 and DUF4098 domain-containing protein YvlB
MKRTFGKAFAVVLLFACIVWIGCGKDNPADSGDTVNNTDFIAEKSFSFQVDVVSHSRLRLEAINGDVAITGISESDSIIITGERRVGSESMEDAEEYLKKLVVNVQDFGNEVFVKTIQPEKAYGRSYVVNYTITLPKDLEILVSSVNGGITIESTNSDVTVINVNGLVTLKEIFGSASVSLVNGQIEGEINLPFDGIIGMSAVNGNIDLNIPVSTSAEFWASVTNGNINVMNLVLQDQVVSNTSLSGTLGAGQGMISLSTVNGIISVSGF